MSDLANLLVDLDQRFDDGARLAAISTLERAGFAIEERDGADDRMLAWIDDHFGGSWSSEAYVGSNVLARGGSGAPAGFATYDPQGLGFAWLRGLGRERDVGIFGPFGVDLAHRGGQIGRSLLTIALCDLAARGYARALIPAVGDRRLREYYVKTAGAREAEVFSIRSFTPAPVRTVVLASGSGTNFQAVLDRVQDGGLPLEIAALVTNNAEAYAIERARTADVKSIHVLPWKRKEATRADYDARLLEVVAGEEPELILLLGWMHLLDHAFVARFPEMINVHPAFLPLDPRADDVGMPDGARIAAFRGPRAVQDAFAAGSPWIGASVHMVTGETDRGAILVRKPLRILPGEDASAALDRLHPIEHQLVIRGIARWLFERKG